ncbi:MAG: hypothetical protein JSS89_01425 [Bacteroidetes bacterium]|nr:hypothetical protein [Bacteroidota bacterium]
MALPHFNLDKLYFDCIDEHGNCFILYWAELRVSVLRLVYSGSIVSGADGTAVERSSFKGLPRPIVADDMQFINDRLKIRGAWQRVDAPISILLYTDACGREVRWNCHHPKTRTTIEVDGKTYRGLGYVETLSLPVKPWLLPIDELRWGRFLSERHTIVWINWKGSNPVNHLICNGIMYDDAVFEEDRILFDGGTSVLQFHTKTIVRKGKLSNLLAKMPWLKVIFHGRILNTIEVKFKAPTSLSRGADTLDTGWSLFEIVTWAK